MTLLIVLVIPGSPPQVRVKAVLYDDVVKWFRITPAGAGKRIFGECVYTKFWDHPRRCG